MTQAYIALGSNLGNPRAQLVSALNTIEATPGCRILNCSKAYRSAAVGPGEQPDYLNAVLLLETSLTPLKLLDVLQEIETLQGRLRTEHWGARTLDLDILLYGGQAIDEARLQVPHPRMSERNFVLYPLLEVANPNLMLPNGKELGTLVADCPRGELEQSGSLA